MHPSPKRKALSPTTILALAAALPLAAAEEAPEPPRSGWAVEDAASAFALRTDRGAITSLRRLGDVHDTDYVAAGARFGDLIVHWRPWGADWREISTLELSATAPPEANACEPGRAGGAVWRSDPAAPDGGPTVETSFDFRAGRLVWTIALRNPTERPIEIGGLAFPCPMNSEYVWDRETTYHRRVIRHASIAGDASFLFWMRCDATPPFLLLMPSTTPRIRTGS